MALPDLPADSELALETPRLVLEPITLAHAAELQELFSDPELHRFTPTEVLVLDQQRILCERWATRRSPDGNELWLNWVARHSSTRAVIGHIQVGILDHGVATVAYLVARRVQREGLAAEALRRVIAFLPDLHVTELKAWIDTRNLASIALVQRLGFEQVELVRNAAVVKGTSSDEYVFSRRLP